MQKRPEHGSEPAQTLRSRAARVSAVALALLLGGCAVTPGAEEPERPWPVLRQIAERLPGNYLSVREEGLGERALSIERRNGDDATGLVLSMIQSDGEGMRRYGLKLEPGALENRLDGEFALLDARGRVRRSCPMDFHLTERELVGKTDPASCRFGEESESVGLLKEIAFDGSMLRIGDRLVDPATGEPLGPDQIIRFLPSRAYSGWLGIREGEQWRVARDFKLQTGGNIEPVDAADMSLGISIALNYYRMERGSDETLMRLTVTELRTGKVVAESWAAPGSATIGVALPDLQVGLGLAK